MKVPALSKDGTYTRDGVDSTYTDVNISKQDVRLYIKRTDQAVISVGYTSEDISYTLKWTFSQYYNCFPDIIDSFYHWRVDPVQSCLYVWLTIFAQTADEITASNLSRRLPESSSKDEFGHFDENFEQDDRAFGRFVRSDQAIYV